MVYILFILGAITIVGLLFCVIGGDSPEQKGKEGEEWVHHILMQLPDEYFLIDNVVLETGNSTTQIDHLVVSKYGVFAIETKNYRGEISGDDNQEQWKQIIVTEVTYPRKWWKTYTYVTKNEFYSPVKQSQAHVFAVKKILTDWSYLPVVPIVVFTGNGILRDVESHYHVIYAENLLDTILKYRTIYLIDEDLQNVVSRLLSRDIGEIVDERTHINNIIAKKNQFDEKLAAGICPRCGGKLVYRTGRYGAFYGCSNYPKCKFTTDSLW